MVIFIKDWGFCACCWSTKGLWALTLPEATEKGALQALKQMRKAPVHNDTYGGIEKIANLEKEKILVQWLEQYLYKGKRMDFPLELDWSGFPSFYYTTLMKVSKIEEGKTKTYGEIAEQLGNPKAVRAVGGALRKNPYPLLIPCHRVLACQGLGGFTGADKRIELKRRLLELEGINVGSSI
ncbi:MGMT family protein [Heliorestis acidaminivorans]|uniref:MGMT family protein n=1 Tax=Heliorestis acidaminivorans TaxID=553427 RepID=A0A6I0F1Y5_9FIRM|nr:MGMT family protein [Heliorestis acidaminivorans]KAB2950758.1 MGMT family protein [Heliorestis acidaminivorans]